MRRLAWALAAALAAAPAAAQQPMPHEWLFGSWTGGLFPAGETEGARCVAQPSVIFTREVVLRTGILDPAYRQRLIETVAGREDGATFRFVPAPGGRMPIDAGFGCQGGPDILEIRRIDPDTIEFPNCRDFPSPLRRCGSPNR